MLQDAASLKLVCLVRESLNCQQVHRLIVSAKVCQKEKLAEGANSKWLPFCSQTQKSAANATKLNTAAGLSAGIWENTSREADLHLCLSLTVVAGCLAVLTTIDFTKEKADLKNIKEY